MAKGQIFLITGVVTLLILVMLRTSMNLTEIVEGKRDLEVGLETQKLNNVRSEILNGITIGYNDSYNMTKNAEDFFGFSRNSMKANTMDLNGLIVSSYFLNVTANLNTALNVTVLNFLGLELENLTITFNSYSSTFSSILDGSSVNTNFTINTASDVNSTLSIYYLSTYENRTENITLPIEVGKSKYMGFFDLRLISSSQEQRDKFTQAYTL